MFAMHCVQFILLYAHVDIYCVTFFCDTRNIHIFTMCYFKGSLLASIYQKNLYEASSCNQEATLINKCKHLCCTDASEVQAEHPLQMHTCSEFRKSSKFNGRIIPISHSLVLI